MSKEILEISVFESSEYEYSVIFVIKMEKEDHRQTASCGSSLEAREYQANQKELIGNGNFREALQMDIDDIHEKFGSKYDEAISQMLTYVDKLETEDKI